MGYDDKLKDKKAILIKQRNGTIYAILAGYIDECDACIFSRYDQVMALSDKRGVFPSNMPIDISICENVTISNGSVRILALNYFENVKQKIHRQIGDYALDLDEIDMNLNFIAGEIIIDDVESISVDQSYYIALLNDGIISIDKEAMKLYDITPKLILYINNKEKPKKYIK